jgi:hypothetical protein
MHTETFYPIQRYNKYLISPSGTVITKAGFRTDKIGRRYYTKTKVIKPRHDNRSGYPIVKLSKDICGSGHQYLHVLLANAFVPNPAQKKLVNHINGNKLDYRLENLEWCSASENHRHALFLGLCKLPSESGKPVRNVWTGERFPSMLKASYEAKILYLIFKKMMYGIVKNTSCFCLEENYFQLMKAA